VTFKEGTRSAWLYDLLNPQADKLRVQSRKNALLKDGNKSDRIDARKPAELLRGNQLKPVYHGETGVRMLRELSRSYLTIVKDLSRVMNRLKAVYRSWAIPCAGRDVYYRRHRTQWLAKIGKPAVRRRAERLMSNWTCCNTCVNKHVAEPLAESRKHAITVRLETDSVSGTDSIGAGGGPDPDSAPFPHPRQPWAYSGLALKPASVRNTAWSKVKCGVRRNHISIRGLNKDHNQGSERSIQRSGHHGQCAS
jgi:transposase